MKPSYSFPIFLILLILLFSGVYYGLTLMKSGQKPREVRDEQISLTQLIPKNNLPEGLIYDYYSEFTTIEKITNTTSEGITANYFMDENKKFYITLEIIDYGSKNKADKALKKIKTIFKEQGRTIKDLKQGFESETNRFNSLSIVKTEGEFLYAVTGNTDKKVLKNLLDRVNV